jgi:hypothetical protein
LLLVVLAKPVENNRTFIVEDQPVNTTIAVEDKFIGTYKGRKSGFLRLNADGTGEYLYDVFLANNECRKDTIAIEWGFLIDENDEIIKFERAYGFSYPILYRSISETSFQSCSRKIMLDYILEYNVEEYLTVSSSDDWIKEIPYQEIEKEAIEQAVESRFSE